MSSSLTFQLRQQQQDEDAAVKHLGPAVSLPSPPNSSYGDEASIANADASLAKEQERRDSLPTHFNALTLQHFSTSLPENYTIEHSSSPIPIQSSSPHSRNINNNTKLLLQRSESPIYHHLSPTATAAATGGRTIRNSNSNRHKLDTTASSSSLPNFHSSGAMRKSREGSSTSTGTSSSNGAGGGKMLHRCEDCGKVYKHPSCLSKHRWEHSDEWELTSKLLLTKHQQVQMLEAAAILVSLDTKRVEQERARQEQGDNQQQQRNELPKEQQHHYLHQHHQQHGHEIDDDDEESIRIDDDDDDDDDETDDDIDMDSISIASSTPSSSPDLLPASFPHGDD